MARLLAHKWRATGAAARIGAPGNWRITSPVGMAQPSVAVSANPLIFLAPFNNRIGATNRVIHRKNPMKSTVRQCAISRGRLGKNSNWRTNGQAAKEGWRQMATWVWPYLALIHLPKLKIGAQLAHLTSASTLLAPGGGGARRPAHGAA